MSPNQSQDILTGLTVRDAMRRHLVQLPKEATIELAIKHAIKYKVNAILIADEKNEALGVVSKSSLMAAYYAGLPLHTILDAIMITPPMVCTASDSLAFALDKMRANKVNGLYVVLLDEPDHVIGVLAYPDILGLLYRYCHKCPRSNIRSSETGASRKFSDHFKVGDVMVPSIHALGEDNSLVEVMETLAAYRYRAVLIKSEDGLPVGVVSTTDLIIAYLHGTTSNAQAKTIMTSPVRSCDQTDPLVLAIQKMIFSDVYSLYVYKGDPQNIVGVLSLADIARVRSGSCRACMPSRITLEDPH